VPTADALDVDGLGIDADSMAKLLAVDNDAWRDEVALISEHFDFIGERLPAAMRDQLTALEKRLSE
jgi:phosphoenolpyruvate carboxykinase (GTP)